MVPHYKFVDFRRSVSLLVLLTTILLSLLFGAQRILGTSEIKLHAVTAVSFLKLTISVSFPVSQIFNCFACLIVLHIFAAIVFRMFDRLAHMTRHNNKKHRSRSKRLSSGKLS